MCQKVFFFLSLTVVELVSLVVPWAERCTVVDTDGLCSRRGWGAFLTLVRCQSASPHQQTKLVAVRLRVPFSSHDPNCTAQNLHCLWLSASLPIQCSFYIWNFKPTYNGASFTDNDLAGGG